MAILLVIGIGHIFAIHMGCESGLLGKITYFVVVIQKFVEGTIKIHHGWTNEDIPREI